MSDEILWQDAHTLAVGGRGWPDATWNRLPARAQALVPPDLWDMSTQPAGVWVGFRTTAPTVHVHWQVTNPELARHNAPAIGQSGLDVYARDAAGHWRWLTVGIPTERDNRGPLIAGMQPGHPEYLVYLPIRNALEVLEFGVAPGEQLMPAPAFTGLPLVYYGTSIVHGQGASRPGMGHASILGRRLDRPVINLGFGSCGRMDMPIADLMGELEAAAFLVDCLPNMQEAEVRARTVPFVRRLRRARPQTPILLIEEPTFGNSWGFPERRERQAARRAALRESYERLATEGMPNLHYVPGDGLLGDDDEATVDGVHPSDLGFVRYAEALEPVVKRLL